MHSSVDELADGIYRLRRSSRTVGPDGFTINQFVVDADEPLLYRTGMCGTCPPASFPCKNRNSAWSG